MCQACYDEIQNQLRQRDWHPSDEKITDFLFSATIFPFACPGDHIREAFAKFGHLKSFAEFADAAAAHADAEMEAAMREYRATAERQGEE
jgi:hypothetical protein